MPKIRHIVNLRDIDGGDDIAISQAGLNGRPPVLDLKHQHPAFHIQLEGRHDARSERDGSETQGWAQHAATDNQRLGHRQRFIDLDGIADVLRSGRHGGVDPDDAAGQVHQRAAAVSRIERGIRLNQIVQGLTRGGEYRPIHRADHPHGDRRAAFDRQRISNGDHRLADPQF